MLGLGRICCLVTKILNWVLRGSKVAVVTGRTIAVAPVVLGINVYLFLSAMNKYRRARFMAEVRLLEDLDEQQLKDLLGNLPPWVKSREWERGRFLNEAFKLVWPAIDAAVSTALKETLEEQLALYAPQAINGITFDRFSFGGTPLSILAIKNAKNVLGADQLGIVWDLDVRWGGVPDIACRLAPRTSIKLHGKKIGGWQVVPNLDFTPAMYVRFTSLTVKADLRLVLSPLLPELPLVKAMKFSFTTPPDIDFDLRTIGGTDLMSMPVLRGMLHEIITKEFVDSMTWPYTFDLNFVEDPADDMTTVPLGVLTVEVVEAKLAPRMATLTRRKIPVNAYVVVVLDTMDTKSGSDDDRQGYNSCSMESTDPQWNEAFEFAVYDPSHIVRMLVGHQRGEHLSQYDLPLGSVDIPIAPVVSAVMLSRHRKGMGAIWAVVWVGVLRHRTRANRVSPSAAIVEKHRDGKLPFKNYMKLHQAMAGAGAPIDDTGSSSQHHPLNHAEAAAVAATKMRRMGRKIAKVANAFNPFGWYEDTGGISMLGAEAIHKAVTREGAWVTLKSDGTRSMMYAIHSKISRVVPFWEQSADDSEMKADDRILKATNGWLWDEVAAPLKGTGSLVKNNVKESWQEVKEWYRREEMDLVMEEGGTQEGRNGAVYDDDDQSLCSWRTRQSSLDIAASEEPSTQSSSPNLEEKEKKKKGRLRKMMSKMRRTGKGIMHVGSNKEAAQEQWNVADETPDALQATAHTETMNATQKSAPPLSSVLHDRLTYGDDLTGYVRIRLKYDPIMSQRPEGPGASVSDNIVTPEDTTTTTPTPTPAQRFSSRQLLMNGASPTWFQGGSRVRGILLVRVVRTVLSDGQVVGKTPMLSIQLGKQYKKCKVPDSVQGTTCSWRQLFTFPVSISGTWHQVSRMQLTVCQYKVKKWTYGAVWRDGWSSSTHKTEAGAELQAHTAVELQDIVRYGRLSGSWKLWSPLQQLGELIHDDAAGMDVGQIFMSIMWLRLAT